MPPDYRRLFEELCAEMATCEHQGDVARGVRDALREAGHDTEDLIGDDGIRHQWFIDKGLVSE